MGYAFSNEAELVKVFCAHVERMNTNRNRTHAAWTAYHETAGFDILLVDEDGVQVGIEAKMRLNAEVLSQALPDSYYWLDTGPDYRAVLVPSVGKQHHLDKLAARCGLTVITSGGHAHWRDGGPYHHDFQPKLPNERDSDYWTNRFWHPWLPEKRCKLPEYVPDVLGGKPAPVALTDWKIRAIKLLITLERRGRVTRAEMKALKISASRWTDAYHGFLSARSDGGYVRCDITPDLKTQHPTNWAQIEADWPTWSKDLPAYAGPNSALQG